MPTIRQLKRAALATVLFSVPALAFAGAGEVSVTINRLQDTVTYSAPAKPAVGKEAARPALESFIGYTVSIANAGGNTINNIRFTAWTVDGAAAFSTAEGASCVKTNAGGTAIECAIGQLAAGVEAPTIALFFRAPIDSEGVAQSVTLDTLTYYGEGTGGLGTSVPQNSTVAAMAYPVALGTFNPETVRSAVQKSGGKLFTGDGAVSTFDDPFTTAVTVPPGAAYTTAAIEEEADCPVGSACLSFVSTLTIPGTFSPYLEVVLSLDASVIPKGTKIGNVLIEYEGVLVGECPSPTQPLVGEPALPCIADRVYFKSSRVTGWTPELDGDFRWRLLNTKNGSFKVLPQ